MSLNYFYLILISVHVESAMSTHEAGFLEALESETTILRKRVLAASSRCQLESSFLSSRRKMCGREKKDMKKSPLVYDGARVYSCSCLMRTGDYASGRHVDPASGKQSMITKRMLPHRFNSDDSVRLFGIQL